MARARVRPKAHSLPERPISSAFVKPVITTGVRNTDNEASAPAENKEETNRVMEWIEDCEKPEIFDLMDDEPQQKPHGIPFFGGTLR